MLYDLNENAQDFMDIDRFTIGGHAYELGPISPKYRKMIRDINPKKDIIESWRPIVAGLLYEWNDTTPELTETIVGAIIPIILKKTNANRQ